MSLMALLSLAIPFLFTLTSYVPHGPTVPGPTVPIPILTSYVPHGPTVPGPTVPGPTVPIHPN